MIRITFTEKDSLLTGFECKGHSDYAKDGDDDILCAFVSSACLMTANTVTEVIGLKAQASSVNGYLRLEIEESPEKARDILQGLLLHLKELDKEYPGNIKVTISEV